jgi:hypothetical protein
MRDRVLSWGVVAAGFYILSAVLVASIGQPVLPLFDGLGPPQPYRWVAPPPQAAATNEPATPGTGEVSLKGPAQNFFVTTEDGQAAIAGLSTVWARQPRQPRQSVTVNLTPLDPQDVGPPPRGLIFDGNAYQVEAVYTRSGDPAVLEDKVQVILRYPRRASVVLEATDSGWRRLESFVIRPSLQVYSEVQELGTFVAAGPPPRVHRRSLLPWIASGAAGVVVAAAGVAFYLRRSKTRKPRKRRRPPAKIKRR